MAACRAGHLRRFADRQVRRVRWRLGPVGAADRSGVAAGPRGAPPEGRNPWLLRFLATAGVVVLVFGAAPATIRLLIRYRVLGQTLAQLGRPEADALDYLAGQPRGGVLSTADVGLWVPALTDDSTYVGHPVWTPHWHRRSKAVRRLFGYPGTRPLLPAAQLGLIEQPGAPTCSSRAGLAQSCGRCFNRSGTAGTRSAARPSTRPLIASPEARPGRLSAAGIEPTAEQVRRCARVLTGPGHGRQPHCLTGPQPTRDDRRRDRHRQVDLSVGRRASTVAASPSFDLSRSARSSRPAPERRTPPTPLPEPTDLCIAHPAIPAKPRRRQSRARKRPRLR